jgi:hypothetical protein
MLEKATSHNIMISAEVEVGLRKVAFANWRPLPTRPGQADTMSIWRARQVLAAWEAGSELRKHHENVVLDFMPAVSVWPSYIKTTVIM